MDAYTKALTELSEIDSRIAALQQRRDTLRKFIELGQSLYGPATNLPLMTGLGGEDPLAQQRAFVVALRESSAKAKILAACSEHISAQGAASTRDLLAVLESKGIEVTGADKINTLSVILSKSDQFKSSRKHGWSLKSSEDFFDDQEETPQGAPTPAGS